MGTAECLKQQHHHHHQVQQLHKYHQMNSSSFKIPMWLCMRPSITQEDHYNEAQDHHEKNKSKKNNRSNSIDEDQPGSPKVGCMGQVKHTHQQQLTFLSTNNHHHQHTTNNNKKYFKLKKMFSSNSFHYNRTTSRKCITGPNNSSKLIHNHNTKDQQEQQQHASSSSESSSTSSFSLVSIGDLDPPLPVIKRSLTSTNVCSSDVSSIWKRRCGGEAALKGLQLSSSATIKRPINSIVIIPQPLASL